MSAKRESPADFALDRFVDAQRDCYAQIVQELGGGRKTSHWMWFAFPQIAGLGMSPTSQRYAIRSLVEARAYLDHEVLGPRLRELTELVLQHANLGPERIFGAIDAMKLRSSLTLFACAAPTEPIFEQALAALFRGEPDPLTLELLGQQA